MKRSLSIIMLALIAMVVMWGCSEEKHDVVLDPEEPGTQPPVTTEITCLSCHSSESELKAVLAAGPVPVPPLEMGPATSDG